MIAKEDIIEQAEKLMIQNPLLKNKILKVLPSFEGTEIVQELLKFLYLVSLFKKPLSPSHSVDLAWHELILFTKTYHQFCEDNFGRYIHHTPSDNQTENQNNYKNTIQQYILHFGEPPKNVWGEYAQQEWQDAQCGSCASK